MADEELTEKEQSPKVAKPAGGGGRGLLIVILATQLLVLAGVGYLFAHQGREPASATEAAKTTSEAPAGAEEPTEAGPPIYQSLDPAFVVNIAADNGRMRFLQLSVQIMSRDKKVIAAVKDNEPIVRNNLLLLFSNQKLADIATLQGKEDLRKRALAEVRGVLDGQNAPSDVEALYFTSFVVQ